VPFEYEPEKVPYIIPESKHTYRYDFRLGRSLIVETKGLFTAEDRKKMVLVHAQHPELDIRFVFSSANKRLSKKSPTTYAKWAEDHGFKWAHKRVPQAWIDEALAQVSTAKL
jgi:hypothetical protein